MELKGPCETNSEINEITKSLPRLLNSVVTMANQVEYDHKYFISLALQNKIAWGAMPIIIEGLTPTLEKSKEVNRFLLKELEKFHVKIQSLEKLQSGNNEKVTESEPCLIKNPEQGDSLENSEAIEDDIEVLEGVKENSQLNKGQKSPYVSEADIPLIENESHDSENDFKKHYVREVDNEWYTFVSNDKTEPQLEPKETERINEEIENLKIVNETDSFQNQNDSTKKQFQCTFCHKSFQQSRYLKGHVRIHTGEVPFECETCIKRFKTRFELKTHERIHTGEVPFQCKTCVKKFSQSCSLKKHERIHTGEVPYGCNTCMKRFNQKGALKIHERIHTGEMPYECNKCNKTFNRKDNLKIHERIHI